MTMNHASVVVTVLALWLAASSAAVGVRTSTSKAHQFGTSTTTTHKKKPTARQLKPRFLANIQRSLQSTMSELASDTYGHLLELCLDADGEPNARVTCTAPYGHAVDYVAAQMSDMGLVPLGDAAQTSYTQTVPNSVDPTWCPPGITNVVGLVEGTEFPNEYVVYTAHLDGPNNENPQTKLTRGNQGVSNAYDNALAVAVGLGLARQLVQNPPRRSVVLLITDGEEGWFNVGDLPLGEDPFTFVERLQNTTWFNTVIGELGDSSFLGMSYWYV